MRIKNIIKEHIYIAISLQIVHIMVFCRFYGVHNECSSHLNVFSFLNLSLRFTFLT